MPRTNRSHRSHQVSKPYERTPRRAARRERHLSVRSELREQPDVGKIARVVIAMAMAQAETNARAQAAHADEASAAIETNTTVTPGEVSEPDQEPRR